MSRCLLRQSSTVYSLPVFLAPAFAEIQPVFRCLPVRSFSSTPQHGKQQHQKKNKDANKSRGVSAMRSTGTRKKLLVDKYPLPQAVTYTSDKPRETPMNENHGLYQFFNSARDAVIPSSEEDTYGRSWTKKELSLKSFDDLWKLHWVCVKEANRIATRNSERQRLRLGYGDREAKDRLVTVKNTMRNIQKVLINRHADYINGIRLLDHRNLVDIFPDAETSIGITQTPQTEVSIEEYEGIEAGQEEKTKEGDKSGTSAGRLST